jgi:hypothetical protein
VHLNKSFLQSDVLSSGGSYHHLQLFDLLSAGSQIVLRNKHVFLCGSNLVS